MELAIEALLAWLTDERPLEVMERRGRKEGERSLETLWRSVPPDQPVPHVYDFRVRHQPTHQPTRP